MPRSPLPYRRPMPPRPIAPPTKPGKTSEPWRIGVLFSQTGVLAVIEETQLRGTLLAIDEINAQGGIHGREVMPIVYDPASEAANCGRLARKMMVEDGVSTIFGCYTSSCRKTVLPIVERLNGLLFYPTLYEGFEFSPNIIYTGAATNQNLLTLCQYLGSQFGPRFYFVGSDYIYARQSNRVMRDLLRGMGGEVVGETYVSLQAGHRDFQPIIRDIRALQPDVVFSTVVGESTIHLYRSHADAGFSPKVMPIASLTTTEAEIRLMGYDVGEGHITAASYFQCIEGDCNSAFVKRYKQRFGDNEPTNMCAEAAYFQTHIFARALDRAGSIDTDVLRPLILGSSFDAPQGKVAISKTSNHTNLWSRIGRANRHGQFDLVRQSPAAIVPDPYLVGNGHEVLSS